jgi:hypothetical protein
MKRFSQSKLIKEINGLLFTFGVTILLLYSAFLDYYHYNLHVQAHLQPQQPPPPPVIGV